MNLACAEGSGVEVLRLEAGWCAILRLPQMKQGGDLAEQLLRECGVVVHPGAFYGIAEDGRVVVSLIGPAEEFAAGMERIARSVAENQVSN